MSYSYRDDDEYDDGYYDDRDDQDDEWGCCYPERCLMSYTSHTLSECHTVEDMQSYEREWDRHHNPRWWQAAWDWMVGIPCRLRLLRDRWMRRGKPCVHCGRKRCDDCQSCDLPF